MAMKNILVIKHGALGDIIQAIDTFESLRLSFVQSRITLLTSPVLPLFWQHPAGLTSGNRPAQTDLAHPK